MRSDAAWYLAGLTGFWGGFAATCLVATAGGGSITTWIGLPPVVLVFGSAAVLLRSINRLETALTGRRVRPWPLGYASLSTQIKATLPWTIAAAGERVGLNGRGVAIGLYVLLLLDLISFLLVMSTRR